MEVRSFGSLFAPARVTIERGGKPSISWSGGLLDDIAFEVTF